MGSAYTTIAADAIARFQVNLSISTLIDFSLASAKYFVFIILVYFLTCGVGASSGVWWKSRMVLY